LREQVPPDFAENKDRAVSGEFGALYEEIGFDLHAGANSSGRQPVVTKECAWLDRGGG
jgi:hypothetical protein